MTEHRKAYLKEYNRKYYIINKERLIARGTEWNRRNKEKRAEITARHRAKHAMDIKCYNSNNKLSQQNRNLKFNYSITLADYNRLFTEQQGLCSGCKKHQSKFKLAFAVDHDHQTNKIRGLLCGQCNTALGLVKDNVETLFRLAEYIRKNRFAYIPTVR